MFNTLNGLGSMVGKMSSAVDRAYNAGPAGQSGRDAASITAGDIRENEERRVQQVKGRTKASVLIGTAEALVVLDRKKYELAGTLFAKHGAVGLGDWEGQVSPVESWKSAESRKLIWCRQCRAAIWRFWRVS